MSVTWSAKKDVEKIFNYLYPPGEYVYLKRRRDWFKQAIGASL